MDLMQRRAYLRCCTDKQNTSLGRSETATLEPYCEVLDAQHGEQPRQEPLGWSWQAVLLRESGGGGAWVQGDTGALGTGGWNIVGHVSFSSNLIAIHECLEPPEVSQSIAQNPFYVS